MSSGASNISLNTILFKKVSGINAQIVDVSERFGISTLSDCAPLDGGEAKESGEVEFLDEDGIDVYDAQNVYIKAFDITLHVGCLGSSPTECRAKKNNLIKYLTTNGTLHTIYLPFYEQGRTNVKYKNESDHQFWRDAEGNSYLIWKITMTVNDPVSDVVYNGTSLIVKKDRVLNFSNNILSEVKRIIALLANIEESTIAESDVLSNLFSFAVPVSQIVSSINSNFGTSITNDDITSSYTIEDTVSLIELNLGI